jgi:methionyl-tRNA formyltransferase
MSAQQKGPNGSGVVMLGGRAESTNIVYHALKDRVPIKKVILEDPVARAEFLRRRAKKLGWATVAGQVAFAGVVVPLLRRSSRGRVAELKRRFGYCDQAISTDVAVRVSSANSDETVRLLNSLAPSVVLINGTRIIAKRVLEQVPAMFINMHAGITPRYRGVHGGYWALAASDSEHCGVTVHVVDAGIDTGAIIGQATFSPEQADTFVTYPYHQLHAGLPLLERALTDALNGRLETRAPAAGDSRLWSHPTIVQYLVNWALRGVR